LSTGGESVREIRRKRGMFCGVNSKLKVVAEQRGGWFSRHDANHCGYTDSWDRERDHHVRVALAIQHRLGGRAVISHQSAVVAYGLPTWGLDLSKVHVTRLAGKGRSDDEVVQHAGRLARADLAPPHQRLTTVARSVVDAARICGYEAAVVIADAALNRKLVTPDQLAAQLDGVRGKAGSRNRDARLQVV